MATNEGFGPYQFPGPPDTDDGGRGGGCAALYRVWIFGPQDDTLPSLLTVEDGDRLVRATRRVVIASTDVPARLVVTWGTDDTPALMFEGLYRCTEAERKIVLVDLRKIFEIRPFLLDAKGAGTFDDLSDEEFRERVLRAIRDTVRATSTLSQKAVARILGTSERVFREECDFRSRRGLQLRWSTLKLDALARDG